MRLPYRTDLAGVDVAIVGVPFDGGTSYRPGTRLAPREIRAQSSLIRPYNFFQKVGPFDQLRVVDAGDIDDDRTDFDGLNVLDTAGQKLGDVDGFIVHRDTKRPYYVVVDSGGWFSSRSFLVPIGHARLDADNQALRVDLDLSDFPLPQGAVDPLVAPGYLDRGGQERAPRLDARVAVRGTMTAPVARLTGDITFADWSDLERYRVEVQAQLLPAPGAAQLLPALSDGIGGEPGAPRSDSETTTPRLDAPPSTARFDAPPSTAHLDANAVGLSASLVALNGLSKPPRPTSSPQNNEPGVVPLLTGSLFVPMKTLPPLMTATSGPPGATTPLAASASTAASVIAPLGSATIFDSLNNHRTASRIGGSSTVTTRSTNAWTWANVTSPGRTARRPSVIPATCSSVTGRPAASDAVMRAAPDGSTPTTRIDGRDRFSAAAIPDTRPPPLICTYTAATSGHCSSAAGDRGRKASPRR